MRLRLSLPLLLVACVFFFCVMPERALAVTEYCPATVEMTPVGAASPSPVATASPTSEYRFDLHAESARSVSGTIVAHTSDGWYSFDVNAVALIERQQHWQDQFAMFKRQGFASDTFYVDFPHAVDVASAFFSAAETSGESVFKWDAKGRVPCSGGVDRLDTVIVALPRKRNVSPVHMLDESPEPAISSLPHFKAAALSSPPFPINCEKPFMQAGAIEAVAPTFPEVERFGSFYEAVTVVQVAVNAGGTLDDAWIFAPSGSGFFDAAAVRAAKESRYSPMVSFCQNVPSTYLYKAVFRR